MDTTAIVAIVIVIALVVLAFAAWQMSQKRRSKQLQQRFGPEYERTVAEKDRRGEAEKELEERAKRVEKLRIRELEPAQRAGFEQEWQAMQARFVDDPGGAVKDADLLVQRVMDARGYPVADFERQAADISVDHPEVVENYRAAHETAETHKREGVSTEALRQATIHYRALFAELLGTNSARVER